MSLEQNRAVVRRLVEEVFNQGNISVVDELFAPDFIEHEELPPGTPNGLEGAKLATSVLHNAYPDFAATIDDMIAEGDKVSVRMTWSGTHQGEFMGLPPTGKRFAIGVFDIVRIAEGKIVEHWGLMDRMEMMQQLGMIPGPE